MTIRGLSVHPGSAKGKLVNAVKLAAELVASLPQDRLSPETTEGREGYVHPHRISGGAEEAIVDFIARDHDDDLLEQHVQLLRDLAARIAEREPRAQVEIEVRDSYRNMRPYIEQSPRVVEAALEAIRRAGVEPKLAITRGGTDGAVLSTRGPADAEPLHRRPGVSLGAGVGERAGHGRGGRDDRRARRRLGRARVGLGYASPPVG